MLRSAHALAPTFLAIARASANVEPSQALREQLARIGREGEAAMMRATDGSNAHRGAIWIMGLLCAQRGDERFARQRCDLLVRRGHRAAQGSIRAGIVGHESRR